MAQVLTDCFEAEFVDKENPLHSTRFIINPLIEMVIYHYSSCVYVLCVDKIHLFLFLDGSLWSHVRSVWKHLFWLYLTKICYDLIIYS